MEHDVQPEDIDENADAVEKYLLPRTFSTGQIARMLRVSIQVIIRAVDTGAVRSYKLPSRKGPKGGFRRVLGGDLFSFFTNNHFLPFVQLPKDATDEENSLPPIPPLEKEMLRAGGVAAILDIAPRSAAKMIDAGTFGEHMRLDLHSSRIVRMDGVLKSLVEKFGWDADMIVMRTAWSIEGVRDRLHRLLPEQFPEEASSDHLEANVPVAVSA